MKRIAQAVGAVLLIVGIGLIVWNDWFRPRFLSPGPGPRFAMDQEEIVGIGAALKADEADGGVRVMGVLPNSPAAKAGIQSGQIITKINGSATEGLSLQQCVSSIRGKVGTKLHLELWNPMTDATNALDLTRERFLVPSGHAPAAR